MEWISNADAFGAVKRLEQGHSPADVIRYCGLKRAKVIGPTSGQVWRMEQEGIAPKRAKNKREAGMLLDACLNPLKLYKELIRAIDKADVASELDAVGRDIRLVTSVLPEQHMAALIEAGKEKRLVVGKGGDIPE